MDPVAPDVPPTSQRVRIALLHNRVVGHNLQVSLQRMEGERVRARHVHELERLKVLDLLSSSSESLESGGAPLSSSLPNERTWLTPETMGSQSTLPASPRPRRKYPEKNSDIGEVEGPEIGFSLEGQRRNTVGTSTVSSPKRIEGQRKKSQSLSEVELVSGLGKENKIRLPPLDLQVDSNENECGNKMKNKLEKSAPRPQSACAPRRNNLEDAQRRRSSSFNLGEKHHRPKRHGLLEPLSQRNNPDTAHSTRVLYAKRFSEPELIFSRPSPLPKSPLCHSPLKLSDPLPGSIVSSSDESVGSEEEDGHLQPYSIGKMCVRESKGSFEQKTGKGGLRAWVGLSSKPKKRPLWLFKKH